MTKVCFHQFIEYTIIVNEDVTLPARNEWITIMRDKSDSTIANQV